jgi:hypothetical protein
MWACIQQHILHVSSTQALLQPRELAGTAQGLHSAPPKLKPQAGWPLTWEEGGGRLGTRGAWGPCCRP